MASLAPVAVKGHMSMFLPSMYGVGPAPDFAYECESALIALSARRELISSHGAQTGIPSYLSVLDGCKGTNGGSGQFPRPHLAHSERD